MSRKLKCPSTVQPMLRCLNQDAAGIDVGASEVYIAVPPDRDAQPVRRFATFTAHRTIGRWRVGGEWIVSGARSDYDSTLAGYGIVNLSARYDITKSWYVDARIDNLFDKDYELAYSYNTPRRGAYLTLGWRPS